MPDTSRAQLIHIDVDRRLGHEWDEWNGQPLPNEGNYDSSPALFFIGSAAALAAALLLGTLLIFLLAPRIALLDAGLPRALWIGLAWWLAPAGAYRLIAPVSRVRAILLAAALPTLATVLVEWFTPVQTTNLLRALAGAPLGGAGALVLARAMATLHYERCTRRPLVPSSPQPPPT